MGVRVGDVYVAAPVDAVFVDRKGGEWSSRVL